MDLLYYKKEFLEELVIALILFISKLQDNLSFVCIVMMSLRSPISVLQEITQQKRVCLPIYNIENSSEIGQPFICTVDVLGISAKAYGTNKKDCKHKAAEKALEILGYIINTSNNNNNELCQPTCSLSTFSNNLPSANYIGQLNEFASGRQFSYPTYHDSRANSLEFAVECKFLDWSTIGTGPNKKSAKKMAAQLMLERLEKEDILIMNAKFQNLTLNKMEISKLTDKVVEKYSALPSFGVHSAIETEVEKPVLNMVSMN
ncbi:unnamed protein product, partial [Callosobruchus maculatus]